MGHKLFPGKTSSFFIHGRVSLSPAPEPPSWGMLLLPWLHGEGWGLWTAPCPPVLVPWGSGGPEAPWARPLHTLVCVYMPGSLQFTALFPACQEALAATQGLSPGEPSRDPLAPRWAAEALSSPRRGTVGGHRWPFSLSGFSKGYSPGWALCLLLLSDTNSCHGVGLG